MGVRTRGLEINAGAAALKVDRAARLEAELVVDGWNRRLATGRAGQRVPGLSCSPGDVESRRPAKRDGLCVRSACRCRHRDVGRASVLNGPR
jgi:hypothetical protein